MARYGAAFKMRVIAWSQNLTPDKAAQHGVERVEKDDLFQQADVLSIHVRLSERTRDLVGERELKLMKPTAYLVNTSRGPIVSEPALIAALQSGKIKELRLMCSTKSRCRSLIRLGFYRMCWPLRISDT